MECFGKITVYFEDPFWAALLERQDDAGYSAARHVFGAEPNDAELLEFALHRAAKVVYSQPNPNAPLAAPEASFKRRQRQARQQMEGRGQLSRAYEAVRLEREQNKTERKTLNRAEEEELERQRFELRQQKRREKHRGH